MNNLRQIIEMLEILEKTHKDATIKVIVGADETDYITSEVQAILVYEGVIVLAPHRLRDNSLLNLDPKETNEEMN